MTAKAPFPLNPQLTAVAMAYRNPMAAYIADVAMPYVQVATQNFKYLIYNKPDRFTVLPNLIGRKGMPNEVEFGATEQPATAVAYGLGDFVPQADVNEANAPGANVYPALDPLGDAVEGIMDLNLLSREQRVASIVHSAATYPTANKVQLTGTSQWSDVTTGVSDPIDDVLTGLDALIARPNTMVLSVASWRVLRTHPKIVKAIHGNDGDTGIAARQRVAELFELSGGVHVGQAWSNTAKPGQAATYARTWGNHCALLHTNPVANNRRGLTFGYTARWGAPVAGSETEQRRGLLGGTNVWAGEFSVEVVSASDVGYFIEDVL